MARLVKYNNGMMSRERAAAAVIIIPGRLVYKWDQKAGPGIRILKEDYEKNGKWSSTTFSVEIEEDIHFCSIRQDWESGRWFNGNTWQMCISETREKLSLPSSHGEGDEAKDVLASFTDEEIKEFIRTMQPNRSLVLDMEEEKNNGDFDTWIVEKKKEVEEMAKASMELAMEKWKVENIKDINRDLEDIREAIIRIKEENSEIEEMLGGNFKEEVEVVIKECNEVTAKNMEIKASLQEVEKAKKASATMELLKTGKKFSLSDLKGM